uniref:Solute carrier family 15 member 4 n=1 Tax=Daphnia galeata TaxID=27404 RepID=A0A8J2RW59_9CRUS|nr:unnamed protein product [Daphnia galeata]
MEGEVRPLLLDPPCSPMFILPWDPLRAKKSGLLILFSVALERLAYFAVVMNLFLYLNKGQPEIQSWEPLEALTAVFVIHGVSCICSPIGGWLSDSLIGRYWAVILGSLVYIIGYCLLTALSINGLTSMGCDWKSENDSLVTNTKFHWLILGNESHPCSVHVYVILVLIGFGVGFLRANIPPFGAEQVRAGGDNAVRQFFNAYYWCVNIGGLIGIGVLAYVEQNVENGFFISYLIATTALCASLIIFCAGKGFYIVHRPGNSVIINVFRILGEATYNTCKKQDSVQGSPMFRRQSQQPVALVALTGSSWVDRAKVSHGGSFHDTTVEDVKSFCKTLVFIFVLLPYWLVYFQMSTSFQAQGLHMNLHLNGSFTPDFEIPAAWLTLCDEAFVLFLIPFLNFVIYPIMDKNNITTAPLCRIVVGMLISLLAIIVAAVVEHFRLEDWNQGNSIDQIISSTSYNASAMSILYQIPQYCLIGTAEVFAGVAGLEYAYTTAPRSFQGIVLGLYSAIEGLGAFLGVLLVQITRSLQLGWIRSEIHFNQGHLDYFFYLLAVIQSAVVVVSGLVIWEQPRRDAHLEETLGASALHSEYYQAIGNSSTPAPPVT